MSSPAVTMTNSWETFPLKHLHLSAVLFRAGWFVFLCADSPNIVALATLHFGVKPCICNPLVFVINKTRACTCIYMC